MKAPHLLLTAFCLLTPMIFLFAQVKPDNTSPTSTISAKDIEQLEIFGKGKWEFLINRKFGYENMANYGDNQSSGHENKLMIDLGATYYFAKGLGVGLDLSGNFTGNHYSGDILNRKWIGNLSFTYGIPFSNNLGVYGRAGIGYGMTNNIVKTSGNSTTTKYNLFNEKGEIGALLRPYETSQWFLNPYVSYRNQTTSFDGGKETESRFQVGLRLEAMLGCDEFTCGMRHGTGFPNRYQQGTSFIGFISEGNFGFGQIKTSYSGTSNSSSEIDFTKHSLGFEYNIYAFHNLAIGAEFQIGGEVQKDKGTDNKVTTSDWSINPGIELNLPVRNGLNDMFLKGGVTFGSGKNGTSNGTNSSSQQTNVFNYCVGLGYNDFFTNRLSFTPIVEYNWNTNKYTDTDLKYKTRGVDFGMRIRAFF
ncbi:MAG TPA: hypothetical protein VNX68_11385 [Nitrosopumilaceae archaeon]|nr:hypothetical protein [Nitrosopumilaceae archaeon]